MTLRVSCPKCKAGYNLGEEKRGKKIRCAKCQELFMAQPTKAAEPTVQRKTKPRPSEEVAQIDDEADLDQVEADEDVRIDEDDDRRRRRRKSAKRQSKVKPLYLIFGGAAVLVVVTAASLFFIFKGKNTPLPGEDKSHADTSKSPVDISKPPDFSLTTSEFADDFKQSAANRKYARGIVELSGVVANYGREMNDDDTLILNPTGEWLSGGEVRCFMTEKEPWERVCEGQRVKIRGRVVTDSREPSLGGCIITEAGPNQATVVTSEEWIREYASNAASFQTKYDDKPLLVTGKIVRTEIHPNEGIFEVYLQGDGMIVLICRFVTVSPKSRQQLKQLQIGQEIRVPGKFSRAEPDQARVGLAAFELISGAK